MLAGDVAASDGRIKGAGKLVTSFKLPRKIKENLISNCDFLKFTVFISGGNFGYLPRAPKT
jgi:hypothetical protein